jgi:ferredoxin-NADP reductase
VTFRLIVRANQGRIKLSITIVLSSILPPLSNLFWGVFHWLHGGLTIAIFYFVWLHTSSSIAKVTTIVAFASIGAAFLLSSLNAGYYCGFRTLTVSKMQSQDGPTTWLKVDVPRFMKVQPGQYVRIWTPTITPFVSRPFLIVWWSHQNHRTILELPLEWGDGVSSRAQRIHERSLSLMSSPYGRTIDLGSFSAVLFVATGSGILAEIPYILQCLIEDPVGVGARKLVYVIWKCRSEQASWVFEWCKRLINIDNVSRVSTLVCSATLTFTKIRQRLKFHVYSDKDWKDKTEHVECHANEEYDTMTATGIVNKFLAEVDYHASELERSNIPHCDVGHTLKSDIWRVLRLCIYLDHANRHINIYLLRVCYIRCCLTISIVSL